VDLAKALAACRRRASALEESQRGHRFIENLTEGYFFYRHDRARVYRYVSPSITRILGYTPDEYIAVEYDRRCVRKEQDPKVQVMAVDIAGSVFTDHFKHGRSVTRSLGASRTRRRGPPAPGAPAAAVQTYPAGYGQIQG